MSSFTNNKDYVSEGLGLLACMISLFCRLGFSVRVKDHCYPFSQLTQAVTFPVFCDYATVNSTSHTTLELVCEMVSSSL